MLLQEGKLACTIFLPWWNDVVRDVFVLVQEGNLARAMFPPQWKVVVLNALRTYACVRRITSMYTYFFIVQCCCFCVRKSMHWC